MRYCDCLKDAGLTSVGGEGHHSTSFPTGALEAVGIHPDRTWRQHLRRNVSRVHHGDQGRTYWWYDCCRLGPMPPTLLDELRNLGKSLFGTSGTSKSEYSVFLECSGVTWEYHQTLTSRTNMVFAVRSRGALIAGQWVHNEDEIKRHVSAAHLLANLIRASILS